MLYGAGLAIVAACGPGEPKAGAGASAAAPVESTTLSKGEATPAPAEPANDAPRALFIGTSLTAGLGLDDPTTESWPAVIMQLADSAGLPLQVANAGLSGETSAGALRRADWLLKDRYDIIVVETGANDGLRGLNYDTTAANIRGIIRKARASSPAAQILLVQMEAPTNMGPMYTKAFHELYARVAIESGATLLPFILEGVGGVARYNQSDGIHPTAEGARLAARTVWPGIRMAIRTIRAAR